MVADSTYRRSPLLIPLLLALPWLSCGSTPESNPDPAVEQHYRENDQIRLERIAKSQDFQAILLDIDKTISDYVDNLQRDENEQAQRKVLALGNWLVTNVYRYRSELRLLLQDPESARARQIAAAALGFDRGSDDKQMTLGLLTQVLETEEDKGVLTNICLGLGIYGSPLTPTDKLFDLTLDTGEDIGLRQSASWALLKIQLAGAPKTGFARTWGLLLEGEPYRNDSRLALNALQGLGHLRDPAHLMLVVPYLTNSLPFLQQAACIAVSRMSNRKGAQYLIPLLGRTERNVNVKLYARKALQSLAGDGVDHEYDWEGWAREFRLDGSPEKGFQAKKSKRTSEAKKSAKETQ